MKLQTGDKVTVHDGSWSYSFCDEGIKPEHGISLGGEFEIIQTGLKMPIRENFTRPTNKACDDVPPNDTLIKELATGKIVSIQEQFLRKIEPVKPALKIGDWVKVIISGHCFSAYEEFFKENNLEQFRKDYKSSSPSTGDVCKIVAIGKHQLSGYGPIYVLQSRSGQIYLILDKGIELTDPPAPKYQIGDKVVPVSKSTWNGLEKSTSWNACGGKKQGYLFVTKYESSDTVVCSEKKGGIGDFFLESDLIPYVEPPKSKFKVGDIITGNSENYYGITNMNMTKGEVMGVHDSGRIIVKILEHKYPGNVDGLVYGGLEDKYFDLVVDELKEVKPEPVKEEAKPAFKVSDRVRVRQWEEMAKEFEVDSDGDIEIPGENSFVRKMKSLCGKEFAITEIDGKFISGLSCGYVITPSMIELLPPINQAPENKMETMLSITFTFKGPQTICRIEESGRKFKGSAKCNPDD